MRRALLAQWAGQPDGLEGQLRALDQADPEGAQGAEARLAIWFAFADPGDGRLVTEDHVVLSGLSDELRHRLAGTPRPVPG